MSEVSASWSALPVYVGCSGNFTIEQILADNGVKRIFGNDVSLYTTALGEMLCGRRLEVSIADQRFAWLSAYMATPEDLAATMILCLEHLPNAMKEKNPYCQWLWRNAMGSWKELHQGTLQTVRKVKETVKLAGYFAGDVVEFSQKAPKESAVIAFPPTYKGGYERMYKPLSQAFSWREPSYQMFDGPRFEQLIDAMLSKREWLLSYDQQLEKLKDHVIARTQASPKSHPVWIYGSAAKSRLVSVHTTMKPIRIDRVRQEDLGGEVALVAIAPAQYAYLREQYLNKGIIASTAQYPLMLTIAGRLAGVMAFAKPMGGKSWFEAYLWCDFVPGESGIERLSKLTVMAALSKEVQDFLTQRLVAPVKTIGTTVYSEKPVSMKYRGVWDLVKREKGKLLYGGQAGKWTLKEAFELWKTRYQR